MTRYISAITVVDSTTKASVCTRDMRQNQGMCVFQLTGAGAGITGTSGGCCCAWVVPSGVSSILIELWGGGGGGGSPVNCLCCLPGTGGGGGAYSRKNLTVTAGCTYTLCVGSGGAGGIPSSGNACCCGQKGGTTYMTGTGLSNFCAEGGYGGESRCRPECMNLVTPNGGWPGNGGTLNLRGGDGGYMANRDVSWCGGWSWGGYSPFGGRQEYITYDQCAMYQDWSGSGKAGGPCGFTGNFPGGGGTGGWPSCCCGLCACGGNGAPGLIRIWM